MTLNSRLLLVAATTLLGACGAADAPSDAPSGDGGAKPMLPACETAAEKAHGGKDDSYASHRGPRSTPSPRHRRWPTAGCGAVTYAGECQGKTLLWCEGGGVKTLSCGGSGCGWSGPKGFYDCNAKGPGPAAHPMACPQ